MRSDPSLDSGIISSLSVETFLSDTSQDPIFLSCQKHAGGLESFCELLVCSVLSSQSIKTDELLSYSGPFFSPQGRIHLI